ncbi:DUF4330 domain-containing protein [Aneurinibacillus uraniidurans]|uniref:DUF4330 domain-containing protein n=1 Tax=Aneurinibacillus uraniidurans TaxID=2966586 RepID=UPI00234BB41B|nr:DUF4330 domain-containing protein [Aneurinibacillus sp. B1]WCN38488.1 DUF4330 domain-containing protein [Aneurinibacillus sp. B1]
MKVIDEKGKFFGWINILDLFLIILLLGAAAFAAVKFTHGDEIAVGPVTKKQVTYTLYNSAEHPFVVNQIKVGDIIRDKDKNVPIGKVVAVKVAPGKTAVPTADGRMVMSDVPEKLSVYITVQTNAVVQGGQAQGEGQTPLLAGNKVSVKGPKYMIETLISDVNLGDTK